MEFFAHLKSYLNDEQIALLKESLNKKSEHALLLNTEKMSEDTLLKIYPNLKKHPIVKNAYIYDKEQLDLGKSIYHELGCFYLQEPSAMLPAYLLSPNENDVVLDLCAAPGGKSMQASLIMNNKGLIISNDLSKTRTLSIVSNAERLGRGNMLITNNDFSLIQNKFLNAFDKIILDAPCSGSGMFRKESKMSEDWSYQKVLKNAEIQKQLILMSYQMLKPGGTMVYSTCSFSYEEDEEVIDYLLDNSDATIKEIIDSPLFYKSKGHGVHLFPYLFPGEGHYVALINKPGECVKKKETVYYQNKEKFGDYLFTISLSFSFKYLNVIRYGVKIGELINKEIRYDYHYAHFVNDFNAALEIDIESLIKYYQGEAIVKSYPKGYVLLKYQGINVDIARSDGRIIKNHLPKGLRKKLIY